MSCDHEIDPFTVRWADTGANQAGAVNVDIGCSKCGILGGVIIYPDEIQWGDE